MSASQWSSMIAHHICYKCLLFNSYPLSSHKDFATAIADAGVLASLSRDGHAFVFRSDMKNAQDLLTTCATYNAKLENSDNIFPSNHDYSYSCKYSAYDQPHATIPMEMIRVLSSLNQLKDTNILIYQLSTN